MLIEKEIPIDNKSFFENIGSSEICFDIETTGLNKFSTHISVIGSGCVRGGRIFFKQWLLDDPSREREMLVEFSKYLKNFDTIIQFNGNSFDIPYTRARCSGHGLEDPFGNMSLIDLYKSAKHLSNFPVLENLKQKSLEQLFGIIRRDRLSGRDCIFAYQDYLRTQNQWARDALLLHNEEDVIGLMKLYPLKYLDDIDSAFKLEAVDISNVISISFSLLHGLPLSLRYDCANYSLEIKNNAGRLILYPTNCVRKLFFTNHNDYYYLPKEDRAIHKSVGAFVDPEFRQKATKTNCYEKINGFFFRQCKDDITPVFKEDAQSKVFWFRSREIEKASKEQIHSLLANYLRELFCINVKA